MNSDGELLFRMSVLGERQAADDRSSIGGLAGSAKSHWTSAGRDCCALGSDSTVAGRADSLCAVLATWARALKALVMVQVRSLSVQLGAESKATAKPQSFQTLRRQFFCCRESDPLKLGAWQAFLETT